MDGLDVPAVPAALMKMTSPVKAMRRLFSEQGTTMAAALSVENGDARS
jgi:hypothetical protein